MGRGVLVLHGLEQLDLAMDDLELRLRDLLACEASLHLRSGPPRDVLHLRDEARSRRHGVWRRAKRAALDSSALRWSRRLALHANGSGARGAEANA